MRLSQTRYHFLQFLIIWIIFDRLSKGCCFFEYPKRFRMKRTIARRFNSINFRKPFVCHREGYFPEGHGDGYFKCSRNPDGTLSRIRLRCLGGQFFDNTLKKCTYARGRRELSKHHRFRNHKPYLYSYNRQKREKHLRPFRNRWKRFSFKKWKHDENIEKKNSPRNSHRRRVKSKKVKDNTVTTNSFVIPSQSHLKSSSKLKHGKHVNKASHGYEPKPDFDENLETSYEEVHGNYDENIRGISKERIEDVNSLPSLSRVEYKSNELPTINKYNKIDKYTVEDANLVKYVQTKRECPDKPNTPASPKCDDTLTEEDQNGHDDSITVENIVISSPPGDSSGDEDNEPEEKFHEHFPKRKRADVNFKIGYGNKNEGDLVIEIPLGDATKTINGENLIIKKQNDVQSTLSPDVVIKLRQSQPISTDLSSATDITLEKIVENRMRLSKNSGSEIDNDPHYHKKDYPNAIFQERSAFDNPNKLRILLGKKKSRLDSRELTTTNTTTTILDKTTSVTPLTTLTTAHTQTSTTTLTSSLTTKTPVVTTTPFTTTTSSTVRNTLSTSSTKTATPTTTTEKFHEECVSETDSCNSTTKVASINQVIKHLKDDYISKIHDHNFTTALPGHHKGRKIDSGRVRPNSFYICSGQNSTNNPAGCNSFYLCHSTRSTGKTYKLKVPCPSGMGFDSDLNKCTKNMGKICQSLLD